MKKKNLIGLVVGELTVLGRASDSKDNRPRYVCSCSCGKTKVVSAKNLQRGVTQHCGHLKRQVKKRVPDAILNSLIWVYKSNAKKRSLTFTLTKEECEELFKGNCYYCGIPPTNVFKKHKMNGTYIYNGIDRLINALGYEFSNSVSCCTKCNYMKRDDDVDIFLDGVFKIVTNIRKVNKSFE